MTEAEKYAYEAKAVLDGADLDGRDLTPEERGEFETLLAKSRQARDQGRAADRLGRAIGGDDLSAGEHGTGWAGVAKAIAAKQNRVEVPTEAVSSKAAPVRRKALTDVDMVEGSVLQIPAFMPLGQDRRFLYPLLPTQRVTSELSVADYRQTGSRTIDGSGTVERELTATTEKAELDLEVTFVSEPLRQVAVVIRDIPNALLDASAALQMFLQSEAQFQLDAAIDSHVVASIEGSDYLADEVGTTDVAKIRNAIGDHREAGYNPTIAVVSPSTAAGLDLYATGADGAHAFPLGAYGASSPLFGLTVVEHAGTVDTTLIDPLALGTLALGGTVVEVDRSAGFTTNTSILRLEASVLCVIRNPQAIYVISSS